MLAMLPSRVGTTTSVRDSAGMPFEKFMRGSARGDSSSVAIQFTTVSASWLAAIAGEHEQPRGASRASDRRRRERPRDGASAVVSAAIAPR